MRDNSSVNRSCRAIAASIMPSVIANSSTPTDCSNLRPTSSIDWQLSKPSGSGSDAAISLAPSSAYFSGLFSRNFSMTDAVGLKVGLKCRQEIRGQSLAQAGLGFWRFARFHVRYFDGLSKPKYFLRASVSWNVFSFTSPRSSAARSARERRRMPTSFGLTKCVLPSPHASCRC